MGKYDNLEDKIIEIIADMLNFNNMSIKRGVKKNDIEEWDSLKHISIIAKLEESFDMNFDPKEIEEMNSIEEIVNVIKNKL